MNRVDFDLPKVSKMNVLFELFNIIKMTSLKIYISPATEKLETSNLDSRSLIFSKGSIGYSASGGSDIISS